MGIVPINNGTELTVSAVPDSKEISVGYRTDTTAFIRGRRLGVSYADQANILEKLKSVTGTVELTPLPQSDSEDNSFADFLELCRQEFKP